MKIKKAPLATSDQVERGTYWPTVRELFIWDTTTKEWIPNEKKMPKIRELFKWSTENKEWWPNMDKYSCNCGALCRCIANYKAIFWLTVKENFTWDKKMKEWIPNEKKS